MSRSPKKSVDLLLRGSLILLTRKCGKPACACAKGAPHQTPALSSSIGGVTKILTLLPQHIAEVRAGLIRYNKALVELDRRALAGIAQLRRSVEREKAQLRSKKS